MKEIILAVAKPNNCQSNNCLSVLPEVSADSNQVQNGLSIIFAVFAAVAIIVIIIAAINFATSEGNPDNISRSKKTIIYALIGLVIALSAEIIVRTVIGKV
jgi:uncharacterized BrkB/YihY/UPF0761 family membrane protein